MRRLLRCAILGVASLLWVASAQANETVKVKVKPAKASQVEACGDHGTSVHFEATPSDAARKALKEEKLVFVLHVSGDFENSDFT